MQETSNTGAGTAGSRTIQPGIANTANPSDVAPVAYWATRKGSAVVARFSATKRAPHPLPVLRTKWGDLGRVGKMVILTFHATKTVF
jgi:hypothetical protein